MDRLGLWDPPKTFGELERAIENTEKVIEEIKLTQGNDIENYVDFELHLIQLKRAKEYNEKLAELGVLFCLKCESTNIETKIYSQPETLCEVYDTTCSDCGHREIQTLSRVEINYWFYKYR